MKMNLAYTLLAIGALCIIASFVVCALSNPMMPAGESAEEMQRKTERNRFDTASACMMNAVLRNPALLTASSDVMLKAARDEYIRICPTNNIFSEAASK